MKLLMRKCEKKINVERPNSNNYQHKITLQAHRKAENIESNVEILEPGIFKVKSFSEDSFILCLIMNCVMKIVGLVIVLNVKYVFHRFDCQCQQNAIKSILCKHIYAVAL